MINAHLSALDYALPAHRVTNAELAQLHRQWRMEQVVLRAGVEERYWCAPGETPLDLAEAACRRLAQRVDLSEVDALLFCTQTPDYPMPPNACLLQHRLGLPHTVAALDFALACSGYIYGLYLAKGLIGAGLARQVLLVTADAYSKWMHPDDRGPVTLFGDGAAATLICAGAGDAGLGEFALRTDGGQMACFYVPAGGARQPASPQTQLPLADKNGNIRTAQNLLMDGAAVLDFVKQEIPPLVRALLQQAHLTLDELDLVVFHQASRLALDFLHRALHIAPRQQFENLARVGNTVSASIPMALRDAETQGVLRPGMRVMLVGFGVGLSWGGCIVRW